MFSNREDAGRQIAAELLKQSYEDPVVFALPRGGVPVAAEVAEALGAPLDLILVRKIGAPRNPEVALAAIVEGDPPDTVNPSLWLWLTQILFPAKNFLVRRTSRTKPSSASQDTPAQFCMMPCGASFERLTLSRTSSVKLSTNRP